MKNEIIPANEIKVRGVQKFLMIDRKIRGWFLIEIKRGNKWELLGNASGLYKYLTREERDAKIDEIRKGLSGKTL